MPVESSSSAPRCARAGHARKGLGHETSRKGPPGRQGPCAPGPFQPPPHRAPRPRHPQRPPARHPPRRRPRRALKTGPSMLGGRSSLWPFLALAVAVGIAALFVPRTPQPLSYHQFTDRRSWLGIPNFGDVVSNIPFLVAGFWGLAFLCRTSSRERFIDAGERWPYAFLF